VNQQQTDHRFMDQALQLARRGLYSAHPNPRVGCVIVSDDRVAGQGWHEKTGQAHAEVMALAEAGELAGGATAYVTLEPCSHHGRTAPCADALIDAGIARVVTAMVDPYEEVSGRGLERLQEAGIEVETGIMEDAARWLNRGFICRCERGRPWVRVKMAVSLDGRTALANGDSQWITAPAAREDVQHWRARASGILTGRGTVTADNPSLTVRLPGVDASPLRIIVDSHWQTPVNAHIFSTPGEILVAGLESAVVPEDLAASGATLLALPAGNNGVDLTALMNELGKRQLNELHSECGPGLAGALIEQGLVDEMLIYVAPKLMGSDAQGMFAIAGIAQMSAVKKLDFRDIRQVGDDLRIIAEPCRE
jgi:diaminohydroxyphosphoribosylaminopyrimidine deaminase/5-amino-6-(5-phosphoribosylamino)uracil reductase